MPGPAIRKKSELKKQRKELEVAFPKQREIVFLLQDWSDGYNVGGLFRVAAACGASELIMVGSTPTPPHPMIGVTSLGMHRSVPFRHYRKWIEAVDVLKSEGYSIVGVELTADAENYRIFSFPDKVCLVLGNEGAGITGGLLKACDHAVLIPMFGKGRSLNVHVAGAIVAFEAMLRP